jgi:threonine aldolase
MAAATVGDDVMREDPTVHELEGKAAALLGKAAGLFVPSGTMGNLISVLVHCNDRGAEYIVGDQAHIYYYEQGGAAQLGGAHPRVVPTNADGTLSLDAIAHAVRPDDVHFPVTKLVCLGRHLPPHTHAYARTYAHIRLRARRAH